MKAELRCAICGWLLMPEPDGADIIELGGNSAMGSVHIVVRACNECWVKVRKKLEEDL